MSRHSKTILWLLYCGAFAASVFSFASFAQVMAATRRVVLEMDWKRGDLHYGSSFILLHSPCQDSANEACECQLSFKAANSEEFANYVSSFGTDKVPVGFDLVYGEDGVPTASKLAYIGSEKMWNAEKFPINDRLLRVSVEPTKKTSGRGQAIVVNSPADCFPKDSSGTRQPPDGSSSPVSAASHGAASQAKEGIFVSPKAANGMIIKKVQPEYPKKAIEERIQGSVILNVLVSKEGNVEDASVISGHPLLAPQATEAVKQWIYAPYSVQGKAVEFRTHASVDFRLPQK
jgi:TonB family protein